MCVCVNWHFFQMIRNLHYVSVVGSCCRMVWAWFLYAPAFLILLVVVTVDFRPHLLMWYPELSDNSEVMWVKASGSSVHDWSFGVKRIRVYMRAGGLKTQVKTASSKSCRSRTCFRVCGNWHFLASYIIWRRLLPHDLNLIFLYYY